MLTLKAYAKINLGLHILRLREDGYHELETVFHRIDLFDEVTLGLSDTLSIECIPAGLPTDERNLCYRAAQLLRRHLARDNGVHIRLRKNIPAGAGLGGGSSDAAASLLGLNRLWRANVPFERLRSIALELGSDVPYFLKGGSACATGRGEILDYFDLHVPHWIVVVYPNVVISTAWAYRHLGEVPRPKAAHRFGASHISLKDIVLNVMHDPRRLGNLLRNDFEPLVLGTYQPVDRIKRVLEDAGAGLARLSGSGSAVYGLFPDEGKARSAAKLFGDDCLVSITPAHFEPDLRPVEQ